MNDKQFLTILAAIIYSQGKGTADASVHAAQAIVDKVDEVLEKEKKEKEEKEKQEKK